MVKLIRLASNNDLNFAANFDADIIVPPRSKLALQNLTFKTIFTSVNINSSNNVVTFTGNIDPADIQPGFSSLLPSKSYSGGSGFNDFLDDIEDALNATLESNSNQPTSNTGGYNKKWNVVYSSFKVPTDRAGEDADPMRYDENSITFRYSILCTPNGPTYSQGFPQGTENQQLWVPGPNVVIEATDQGVNTVQMRTGVARTTGRTRNVICNENIKLSKGNALFMVRIADYNFNGEGSEIKNNGFGIGITTSNLINLQGSGTSIPLADRQYGVIFNRDSEGYLYHNRPDFTIGSTIYPQRVSATTYTNPNHHDIMWCRIDRHPTTHKQILRLGVWQIPIENYYNLPAGNIWTQTPTVATETFDETDLGDVATYRMTVTTGTGVGTIQWWKTTGSTTWDIFNAKPVEGSVPDGTAVIDTGTGAMLIGGVTTLTPAQMPTLVELAPGAAVEHVFLTHTLSDAEIESGFYPYMYMRGSSVDVKADAPCFTVDPYMEGNGKNEITGFRDYNIPNILKAADFDIMPTIDVARRSVSYTAKLTMHSNVWSYLGFSPSTAKDINGYQHINVKIENSGDAVAHPMQATWFAVTESQLDADDNFIVESLTLPLDCYDASEIFYSSPEQNDASILTNPQTEKIGRRKNILATIPISDNNNGLVQYDTNTPVFIDLKNTESILLRNIRLRVLRQDFSPVETGSSSSIMTLLLDTGN